MNTYKTSFNGNVFFIALVITAFSSIYYAAFMITVVCFIAMAFIALHEEAVQHIEKRIIHELDERE